MDVRQYAFLARQPSAALKTREHFWGLPKRGLAFLLVNVMFWQPLWAQADGIVVATPGTTLDHAGNGVQIINIATPNGSGLSHNQFHDYNVGAQGLILNNGSTQTSSSQLGGIVIGNPHLKNSGSAQTILNEVIGGSPSQLSGYTEVAGQSARVIVANPYGITCNGCGFINTPRVTLTTGKPVLDGSGRVERFQVDQGSIAIEGAGLNASNVDRFEIITRSAKINAEIQANNLSVIAGRNDVNADSLNATARADDGSAKPQLAIDSSALGGMYAGAIRLVGTEAGVGVKVAGNLAASAGDIQIDANGQLTLAQTSATGAVNVKAASLDAQGPVYAGTAVNVQTQGDLTNRQTLAARDSITLNAGGHLTNNGTIEAGVNADASRNQSGDISLTAQNLVNTGKSVVASRNLTLKADQVLNGQGGLIKGQSQLDATVKHLGNNAGEVSSQGNATLILGSLDNSSGVLMAQMGLDLSASDVMINRGGLISGWQGLTIKGTRLDNSNSGTLSSRSGDVDIRLNGALVNNTGGALVSQKALTVTAASLDNSTKGIVSSATGQTISLSGLIDNSGEGLVASGAALTLNAMALNNLGGTVNATGDLQFNGTELNNSQGTFIGKQAITLDLLGALINTQGRLSGAGPLRIQRSTRVDNQGGELSSQNLLSLLTGHLDNSGQGTLSANDQLLIDASDTLNNTDGGLIASRNADLDLSAASVANAKGQLQARTVLQLNASGDIDNQNGQIVAKEGALSLKAANLDNRAGHVAALNDDASVEIATHGAFNNRDGSLYAKTLLQVGTQDLDNSGGQISASQIGLDLRGALNNRSGLIESLGTLTTKAASLDNQNGQLRALGISQKSLFSIDGNFDNRDGRMETANTDLSIEATGLQNQGGSLLHSGSGVFGIAMANLNDVGGRLATHGDLTLDADAWTNSTSIQAERLTVNVKHLTQTGNGQLLAGTHLAGTGIDWSNDGLIGSDGDISLDLSGNYAGKGRLSSLGALDLHAARLDLESSASIAGGADTRIDIDALLNNAGRITSSDNLTLTASGINNSGTLASGKDLTATTGALFNDHGLISSGGNLQLLVSSFTNRYAQVYSLGSVLIGKDAGQTQADLLDNRSGAIESLGPMTIAASTVNNVMDVLEYNQNEKSATSIVRLSCALIPGAGCDDRGGGRINGLWEIYETDRLRVTKSSAASSLSSGADMLINTQTLTNTSSTVAATGNLQVNATTINNQGLQLQEIQTVRRYWSFVNETGNAAALAGTFNARNNPNPSASFTSDLSAFLGWMGVLLAQNSTATNGDQSFAAILQAGADVKLNASQTLNNSVVRSFYAYVGAGQTQADTSAGSGYSTPISINPQLPPALAQQQVNPVTLPGFTLPSSPNGLFRLSSQGTSSAPTPSPWTLAGLPDNAGQSKPHKYLIETNPALTDLKQFMSSDYLLSNLGFDPDISAKRLGDGLYEQRMIQQAVVARTGQRFIDGQTSDEALFKYLMDNALQSKQSLNLSVGVSLTAEQVAALTHDIVWLESHEVNGEQVLVPVLYLAHADNRLAPTGALIAGKDVSLISGQNLNNVGTLRASNNLSAVAGENIVNSGLAEADKRLDLLAGNNLVNRAGGIIAGRDVSLATINGDVVNERTVTTHQSSGGAYTQQEQRDFVDSAARIEAGNDLTVKAGQDINVIGGALQSVQDMSLNAGRDVNVSSVQVTNSTVQGSKFTSNDITQLGSSLNAGRDLSIQADRNISVIASDIDAQRNIAMAADENLTVSSAANEQHSLFKSKPLKIQEDHVSQVMSDLTAGGSVKLSAGQNLAMISSQITAGDEAYLVAGNRLDILAAQDTDYSLYDMKKKGGFGAKETKRDEVTDVKNIGSQITSGGNLTLVSGGDQLYQGAKLESGKDLTLDSGGSITFEAVKDKHQESHDRSTNSWAWTSMENKGQVDETLRQSQLTAKGQTLIKAVDGLHIDIKDIDQKTVSQVIDAMVQADPSMAWLKDVEARGDVDWRRVKELHDSWDESHSGLGGPAMIIIVIIVTYFTAGAASTFVASAANATASSAFAAGAAATAATATTAATQAVAVGWANAALTAMITSAAGTAAVSTINNKGNLGAAVKETFSAESMKNYIVSGAVAGLAAGLFNDWTRTTTESGTALTDSTKGVLANTGKVVVNNAGGLSSLEGIAQFTANQALQNSTSALLNKALGREGSLGDALQSSLVNAFAAYGFNLVGDIGVANQLPNGGLAKIGLHAVMGGLASLAAGGDFKTGALAAGVNEALVDNLSSVYSDMPKADRDRLLAMNSQLIGVLSTAIQDPDADAGKLQIGSWVAQNGTLYNRQLHADEQEWIKGHAKEFAEKNGISEEEATKRLSRQALKDVDFLWRSILSDGDDSVAQAFLSNSGQTFTNDLGGQQALFTAKGQQLFRPEMFADTADPKFYQQFVQSGVNHDLGARLIKELKDSGVEIKNDAIDLAKLATQHPDIVLNGLWEGVKGLPQSVMDGFEESGHAIGEGASVRFNEDLTSKLNTIYGQDVSTAQTTLLAIRTFLAVSGAGSAAKVGGKLSEKAAEAIGKKLDAIIDRLAEQASIKSGGAKGVPSIADSGASSAANAARLKMQMVAEQAAGARAPTQITSYSNHALEQFAGRDGGIGVSESALSGAWSSPLKIEYVPSKYGPTFRYTGTDAVIVVNTEGKVVTGWGKSASGTGK